MAGLWEFLGGYDARFYGALVLGCVVILLFSKDKFLEPSRIIGSESPEGDFRINELTSKRSFLFAYLVYSCGLLVAYLLVCLVGPGFFYGLANPDAKPPAWSKDAAYPIGVALALVGVLPHVPLLDRLESQWRKLMHVRAEIPTAVNNLILRLSSSRLCYENYQDLLDAAPDSSFKPTRADFDAEARSDLNRWARICALVERFGSVSEEIEVTAYLKSDFITKYRDLIGSFEADRSAIDDHLQARLQLMELESPGADAQTLQDRKLTLLRERREELSRLLRRVYAYLACAILDRRDSVSEKRILQFLGFEPDIAQKRKRKRETNTVGYAFVGACIATLLFAALAPYIGDLSGLTLFRWPTTEDPGAPFVLFLSYFSVFGPALLTALWFRRVLIRNDGWIESGTDLRLPPFGSVAMMFVLVAMVTLVAHYLSRSFLVGPQNPTVYFQLAFPYVLTFSLFGVSAAIMLDYLHGARRVFPWMATGCVALIGITQFGVSSNYYRNSLDVLVAVYPDSAADLKAMIPRFESGAMLYDIVTALVFVTAFYVGLGVTSRRSPALRPRRKTA